MRATTALIAILVSAPALADDSSPIPWSRARLLSWSDFTGPVPADADARRVAATTASISWSFKYEVVRSDDRCTFTITEISSVAEFIPDSSWVRPTHMTPVVLEHEHGHFDIAHYYSQEFIAATRDLVGFRGECRGRSNRQATANAEDAIRGRLGAVYDDVWSRYRAHQEAYDEETRHGSAEPAQDRWTADIAALLAE